MRLEYMRTERQKQANGCLGLGLQEDKPYKARDEPSWSLPEDLATGTVRGLDHA